MAEYIKRKNNYTKKKKKKKNNRTTVTKGKVDVRLPKATTNLKGTFIDDLIGPTARGLAESAPVAARGLKELGLIADKGLETSFQKVGDIRDHLYTKVREAILKKQG